MISSATDSRNTPFGSLPNIASLLPGAVLSGEANSLHMRPDPVQFVQLLKELSRKDVSSALFIRALDEYAAVRHANVDPLRCGPARVP